MKLKLIFLYLIFVCTVFAQTQDEQTFRLAQAFEQANEFERAADLYLSLFKKDSLNYTFYDALRRCYIQLKRYNDALTISYARLKKFPFDFNLQSNIGGIFYTAGKEQQADSVWNFILRSANKNQVIYRIVAGEQANQRLFEKAVNTYKQGRKEIGSPFLFANELSYYYTFMMDYTNATREYLLLLRQDEQQLDFIQSRLAQFTSKPDGLSAATRVLEEEIKNEPNKISTQRLLLWLYVACERFTDAFMAAKTIEEKINSNGAEMFQFAERVFREKAFAVAANAYQLAIKNGPTMQFLSSAKFGFARCVEELSAKGDTLISVQKKQSTLLETQPTFNGAVSLYETLVKEYPYSSIAANSLFRIGVIRYKQLFDIDGAKQMFDSVLTISPVGALMPQANFALGEINIAKGKLDEAAKKFSAVAKSPQADAAQQTQAQFRLAELQYFQFQFDSANALLAALTQNLKADEANDALLLQNFIMENKLSSLEALKEFARAELLFRQNKITEAVTILNGITADYANAPLCDDALLRIAEFSIFLKRYNDALTAYKKLISDYPKSIGREKIEFKIAELFHYYLNDTQQAIRYYEIILEKNPFSLFAEEARKRIRQLRGDNL